MSYTAWSVVFGEQPSATKWNLLGSNDADFNTRLTRSGMAVQTVVAVDTAVATGSTQIPQDDTIPQITEGDQYLTKAITPISASNTLLIEAVVSISHSAIRNMTVALFQDATANALAAVGEVIDSAGGLYTISLRHSMTSGTTSGTTFRIRAGADNTGTTTYNGKSSARIYGAITKSFLSITEIAV